MEVRLLGLARGRIEGNRACHHPLANAQKGCPQLQCEAPSL
jgi:hypothetical protein